MCDFFSIISDGNGKAYWFDWKVRKKILDGKLDYGLDSHTSIADYYGFKGMKEDKMNKFEFNPLTKEFKVDQLNTTDDSEAVKKICMEMDWKKVVPQLVIKEIFNPFSIESPDITERHKMLLDRWASVRDSVRDSVWASVGDSVGDSVRDSVWASVGDSVGDSVWAYVGSFFNLKRVQWKYTKKIKCRGYPFQCAVDLWMDGLVPAHDGKSWSIYGKRKGKVVKVYEKPKEGKGDEK